MNPIDKQQTKPPEPLKKAYSTPQLQVYGNMREVTRAIGISTAVHDSPNHTHTA